MFSDHDPEAGHQVFTLQVPFPRGRKAPREASQQRSHRAASHSVLLGRTFCTL